MRLVSIIVLLYTVPCPPPSQKTTYDISLSQGGIALHSDRYHIATYPVCTQSQNHNTTTGDAHSGHMSTTLCADMTH